MNRYSLAGWLLGFLLLAFFLTAYGNEDSHTYLVALEPYQNDKFIEALRELANKKSIPLYDRDLGESAKEAARNAAQWGMKLHGYPGISVPTRDVYYTKN